MVKVSSLVLINDKEYGIISDIVYGTPNNFTKKIIYKNPVLMLHEDALKCLEKAIVKAKSKGYTIKVFDGFRPIEAQQMMYDLFPGTNYVSDPKSGLATHTRGIAIDLTLVDAKTFEELDMGTEFDSFEEAAHHFNESLPAEVKKNREVLLDIMTSSGFEYYKYEWWHYQLPDFAKYPKIYDTDNKIKML